MIVFVDVFGDFGNLGTSLGPTVTVFLEFVCFERVPAAKHESRVDSKSLF